MKFSYDDYQNINEAVIYLYNPDQTFLGALNYFDGNVTLRYSDLSDLSFSVPSRVVNALGEEIDTPLFDAVEVKRLVNIPEIGWFQITQVEDVDDGITHTKNVTTQSIQCTLKERGLFVEERVYYFYQEADPLDEEYDMTDDSAVPSVIGQLHSQLGIELKLDATEDELFDEWTITYIDPAIYIDPELNNITARSFRSNGTEYGYDFMVNTVGEAFGAVFDFDIIRRSIAIRKTETPLEAVDVYLSLDNLANSISVSENAENIVTVLNCSGNGFDISYASPAGVGYLVDFSYYMDETNYKWMSKELIDKLKEWQTYIDGKEAVSEGGATKKQLYEGYIQGIDIMSQELADLKIARQKCELKRQDLERILTSYLTGATDTDALISVEEVSRGNCSIGYDIENKNELGITIDPWNVWKKPCSFYQNEFGIAKNHTDDKHSRFTKPQGAKVNTVDAAFESSDGNHYIYFTDVDDNDKINSYCVLGMKTTTDTTVFSGAEIEKDLNGDGTKDLCVMYETLSTRKMFPSAGDLLYIPKNKSVDKQEKYYIYGDYNESTHSNWNEYSAEDTEEAFSKNIYYTRYILPRFTVLETGKDGKTTEVYHYDDLINWVNLYTKRVQYYDAEIAAKQKRIADSETKLSEISQSLNIINYFTDSPKLLKELRSYWIEGDYVNDSLAVLENTTTKEIINMANELIGLGKIELSKICKPTISLSVDAINFLQIPEYKDFAKNIELGKIIAVEKRAGFCYYPVLTEMSFALDDSQDLSLVFSDKLRDSWGATYADMLSEASSTSKSIKANWNQITKYSKEEESIKVLIANPLEETLRAATSNMVDQDFVINTSGILGRRKKADSDDYELEQVKMSNNVLMFTDDGWKTAKTALGKIYYEDPETGETVAGYGLIAETIIGSLVMGETMKIVNSNNGITLDKNGIEIKNGDETVFKARTDGTILVKGMPSEGRFAQIESNVTELQSSVGVTASWIDNFQVGGRNLLSGTSDPLTMTASSTSTHYYKTYTPTTVPLKNGGTYTFSADVEVLAGNPGKITVSFYDSGIKNYYGGQTIEIKNGRITASIKIDGGSAERFLIYCGIAGHTNNNSVKLYNMKLEEGTVPTGWSPAPEDVSASIADIRAKADANGAFVGLFADYTSADGSKTSGSIVVEAVNGSSNVKISADKLDIAGKELNIKVPATNITGTVTASQINTSGINVSAGYIANYVVANSFIRITQNNKTCGIYGGTSGLCTSLVGSGTSSVRFFAGASGTNSTQIVNAPFRVLNDGSVYMTSCQCKKDFSILNYHSDTSYDQLVIDPEGVSSTVGGSNCYVEWKEIYDAVVASKDISDMKLAITGLQNSVKALQSGGGNILK